MRNKYILKIKRNNWLVKPPGSLLGGFSYDNVVYSRCKIKFKGEIITYKPIPRFNKLYLINQYGQVWDVKKKRYLKPFNIYYYKYVYLKKQNERRGKSYPVHRLVAVTFIPNPHRKKEVNHIDHNRSNNYIFNLEWITHEENRRLATIHYRNLQIKFEPEVRAILGIRYKECNQEQFHSIYNNIISELEQNLCLELYEEDKL